MAQSITVEALLGLVEAVFLGESPRARQHARVLLGDVFKEYGREKAGNKLIEPSYRLFLVPNCDYVREVFILEEKRPSDLVTEKVFLTYWERCEFLEAFCLTPVAIANMRVFELHKEALETLHEEYEDAMEDRVGPTSE